MIHTIIVEDDRLVRLVLARALEARGHQVRACGSAEEALSCYAASPASLVIVDLRLPGMSGLELCAQLRASEGEELHLLVVTAQDEALDEALEAGADDYLPKPFEQRTLEIRLRIAERNIAQLVRRREAERALVQAREDLRRVIDHLPAAVVIHHQGVVRYSNPAWLRLTGCARAEQMEGRELHSLLLPGDSPSHQRLAQHLRGESLPQGATLRLLRPDGEAATLELAPPRALTWRHAPATLLVALDVTAREAIQARLFLTERMASIGTMSAGIAHELNNPLSFILGNLGQLLEELDRLQLPAQERADFEEMLRDSLQGAQRVAAIVQDLRTYSGLGEEQQTEVSLPRVLEMALTMAGPALRRVEIQQDLPCELPHLLTHEARLGQILYQLLLNAAQAIPPDQRGLIEVRARHLNHQVEIELRDNGAGMAPEVLRRVFDPFFTTRGVHGAGLGLFVCHNLARSLGGDLTLESTPGRGTLARVTLPALSPPRRHHTPPPSREPRRVLIFDPDPQVARGLKRALSAHQVTLADHTHEAADALQQGRFDAILCDLSGDAHAAIALHDDLQRRDPAQAARFIWMISGPTSPSTQIFLAQVHTPRLEKPFSVADLFFLLQNM